jgi:predicted MPP superfamily phosphohydrolase
LRWAAGCCLGAGAAYSTLVEPSWLEPTLHDVPVRGLDRSLSGLRIAQLSDLHLHGLSSLHDRVLELVRAHDPELVVLTGDVIEDRAALPVAGELAAALAVKGREVVVVPGNWEHWGEIPWSDLRATYAKSGARWLENESIRLRSGIRLIALGDDCSGHADPSAAFRDVGASGPRVLLTHAPGILDALPADAPSFDLGLAGHTHGGQVCALGASVWVPPGSGRFRSGMYETPNGRAYVSRGIGTSVVPARLTCRPELPIFRLVAA